MCMKMEYESIKYEVEARVGKITMIRPEKMNALDNRLGAELADALHEASHDPEVKVVVLTGSGKAFCAGGDVTGFVGATLEQAVEGVRHEAVSLVGAFTKCPKPIIGAVNGFAVGAGLSLALLCDLVIASDKAKFGAAFVGVGLVPDIGAMWFLPRLVGLPRAKELAFTGRTIGAAEAEKIGLLNQVVEHDKFEETLTQTAGFLAAQPGLAMASAKKVMHAGLEMGIDELLELEGLTQGVCMMSEDSKEGVDAFLNKRKPNFK